MNNFFKINGANKLTGKINITGAKNSSLALLIASVLTDKQQVIEDVPDIKDTYDLIEILEYLGSKVIMSNQGEKKVVTIDNSKIEYKPLYIEQITRFRASYYFMGAMISRFGKCELLLPGGCYLGPRPIDLHLKGFETLGCEIIEKEVNNQPAIEIYSKKELKGNTIFLDFPSVGATMNLLLAATLIPGETIIENAAKEPEIIDLVTLLNTMGAKVQGGGTSTIAIKGVSELKGCFHQVIPDRIEAGSYLMLAGLIGENLVIDNVIPEHLEALISKLIESGVIMEINIDNIKVIGRKKELTPIKITTGVFPSFPTDLQQPMATYMTQLQGESEIKDTIYSHRFKNCDYLNEMGANITTDINTDIGKALINGKSNLIGGEVYASDLRAGFSLIMAGLIAKGETRVYEVNHILRGYDKIIYKLQRVGADIMLVEN